MPIARYAGIPIDVSFTPPVQPPPWIQISVGRGLSGVRVT